MALCLTIPTAVLPLDVPALLTFLKPAASYYLSPQVQDADTEVNGQRLGMFGRAHPSIHTHAKHP